jgi:hypothetical protein
MKFVETLMRKLNGWKRIGVVLSTLWLMFVLASAYIAYINDDTTSMFITTTPEKVVVITKAVPGRCTKLEPAPTGTSIFASVPFAPGVYCPDGHYIKGTPAKSTTLPAQHRLATLVVLIAAIIPILLVWLLVQLLLVCIRWIVAGFRQS